MKTQALVQGDRVELVLPAKGRAMFLTGVRGVVSFELEGWIYWIASDDRIHASRPDALRRLS